MAFAIFKLKDTVTAAAMQMRGIVEPEHSVFMPFVDTRTDTLDGRISTEKFKALTAAISSPSQ